MENWVPILAAIIGAIATLLAAFIAHSHRERGRTRNQKYVEHGELAYQTHTPPPRHSRKDSVFLSFFFGGILGGFIGYGCFMLFFGDMAHYYKASEKILYNRADILLRDGIGFTISGLAAIPCAAIGWICKPNKQGFISGGIGGFIATASILVLLVLSI